MIGSPNNTPGPATPAEASFRALLRSIGLVRRVMEPYFARFNITGAQWGVLRTFYRAEAQGQGGLRLTDVGERLLIRPPSVTTVVDRLQKRGLVSRRTGDADQRTKHLSLTEAGRGLVMTVLKGHRGQIRSLMKGLDAGQQRELERLLGRLATHLETLAPRPESQTANQKPAHRAGEGRL